MELRKECHSRLLINSTSTQIKLEIMRALSPVGKRLLSIAWRYAYNKVRRNKKVKSITLYVTLKLSLTNKI